VASSLAVQTMLNIMLRDIIDRLIGGSAERLLIAVNQLGSRRPSGMDRA